ncbi:MAG: HNH endonuclease [Candidatus Schekmanbacteria bacterium]|nr:HNH endonuclease [Candidatus Schekmanbacteria bacterium]
MMKWKDFVYKQVIEHCNKQGSRTFSLQDILKERLDIFRQFRPENKHVEAKIRQQLQYLRDEKLISFLDNSGHYTLRGIDLLEAERDETKTIDLTKEEPEKREYLVETYVRNVSWAKQAKKNFGDLCLYYNCSNTFLREDGTRYIEVHHIIPLYKGGEDGLWNLSVLCAHHHRMAHYSDTKTRIDIEKFLLREVESRL